MSAGEPLGAEMLKWGEDCLNVKINEMYGQTEVNYFIGNCQTCLLYTSDAADE